MKKKMESMEMEVMEARLLRASELNGELDDDDDDAGTFLQLKTHADNSTLWSHVSNQVFSLKNHLSVF